MQADVNHLKEQYAMLSDDALLAIHRSELVEEAQTCYDAELRTRDLEPSRTLTEEEGEERPEWLEDAAQVFSSVAVPGTASADDAMAARDALKAAGIPCFLELHELPQQTEMSTSVISHEWRVMVPGKLNLRATSVLEAELFNENFEGDWRGHLQELTDAEVLEMRPEIAFAGLFDKIRRLTAAYDEELARRGLAGASD